MSRVIGVDLASGTWADNGSALLEFDKRSGRVVGLRAPAIPWPASAQLNARTMAEVIDSFARSEGVCAVALDGPQGWRDPATPHGAPGVGRRCEYLSRTQGKTGVYPRTYPGNQRPWMEFCIDVFSELLARPRVVLANDPEIRCAGVRGYLLLECFPTAAWRSTGVTPLPRKAARPMLAPYVDALVAKYDLPAPASPLTSHDDVQAIVAAVCALPVAGGAAIAEPVGVPGRIALNDEGAPRRVEGLIWNVRPRGPAPATIAALVTPARRAESHGHSDRSRATRFVKVTQAVLDQVARAGPGQAQIAMKGFEPANKKNRCTTTIEIGGIHFRLVIGDTGCCWRSHQVDETRDDFEALFALLADQPGVSERVE
jgi:hypothetical protein